MAKYTFDCPDKDCNFVVEVDADSEEEAMAKIMEAGVKHGEEVHPDMEIPADKMKAMVAQAVHSQAHDHGHTDHEAH